MNEEKKKVNSIMIGNFIFTTCYNKNTPKYKIFDYSTTFANGISYYGFCLKIPFSNKNKWFVIGNKKWFKFFIKNIKEANSITINK